MTDGVPLCVLLFRYASTSLAVCLGSLACCKNEANSMFLRWYCMEDQNLMYFSVFLIQSILTKSPTPVGEMQLQTTAGPLCFTDSRGCLPSTSPLNFSVHFNSDMLRI